MIITNKLNLPQPLVSLCQSEYQKAENEYRATELLKSTRECILTRRHANEIEVDASEMIWLLFGTAAHAVLEGYTADGLIKEQRLSMNVGNKVVTGKSDLYVPSEKKVIDYKTASVWKIIYGNFDDWRKQLLIYAILRNKNGYPCDKGEIVAFLKDHNKRDARFKPEYPKLPVRTVNFRFAEEELRSDWIEQRIAELEAAEQLADDDLPMCTPEERYNNGDKYAVMKKGRKKASRVFDNVDEAAKWIEKNGGDYVEVRKGEDKKCLDYCFAAPFCDYWREHYGQTEKSM